MIKVTTKEEFLDKERIERLAAKIVHTIEDYMSARSELPVEIELFAEGENVIRKVADIYRENGWSVTVIPHKEDNNSFKLRIS